MAQNKSTASKKAATKKSSGKKASAPAKASTHINKNAVTRSGANKKEFYEAREKASEEAMTEGRRKLSKQQLADHKAKTEEHDLEVRPVSDASLEGGYYGAPREMGIPDEPIGTFHALDGSDDDEDEDLDEEE